MPDPKLLAEGRECGLWQGQIGNFVGSEHEWDRLIGLYDGNPLAIELAARHIAEVYGGSITDFLRDQRPIFGNLRELLDWHLGRLTQHEKEVLYWLTVEREPVSLIELRDDLVFGAFPQGTP